MSVCHKGGPSPEEAQHEQRGKNGSNVEQLQCGGKGTARVRVGAETITCTPRESNMPIRLL